tara:strand:+ start:4355 stop:4714 length:360 start_codon:yes stop_codon:yes gene_type:complete
MQPGPILFNAISGMFMQIRGKIPDTGQLVCSEESEYFEGALTSETAEEALESQDLSNWVQVQDPQQIKGVFYDGRGWTMGFSSGKDKTIILTEDEKVYYNFLAFLFEKEQKETLLLSTK